MISEFDRKRISNDAYIAYDALEALMCAYVLTEDYVAEKVRVVESCLRFIKNFEVEK